MANGNMSSSMPNDPWLNDATKPGMPDPWAAPKSSTSQFGNPATFTSAANQQGGDYDAIMKQYQDFINSLSNSSNSPSNQPITTSSISPGTPITSRPITSQPLSAGNPLTTRPISSGAALDPGTPITSSAVKAPAAIRFNPLTPQTTKYEQSQDVTDSLGRLKNLVDTGGYSAEDIQNIRDRDTSPIRSIYSSGQQGLERQRALSGGYSPNFNAVLASMARDEASQIGNTLVNANAGIAQNVASNKLATASPYAAMSGAASAARVAADQKNADIVNQINQYNSNMGTDVNEFNTTTGLGVDKYNRDTQIGLDTSNRDTRLNADKYNRDTQLNTDKYNKDTQLGVDTSNRDFASSVANANRNTQIGLDTSNRDTQIGLDKSNRDTQLGVASANRDAKFNTDKTNADNNYRLSQSQIQAIMDAIKGKSSLYGTTPALASLFGNQVGQAAGIGQGQQDINARRRATILSAGRG